MENKLNCKFMHISFCAELGNSAWQWFATHTHRNIFHLVFYSLPLLLRTSVTHFLGCCTFPPLCHYCPPLPFSALSSEEASMRYFQKRAQLTRHRWKRTIWNRALSRVDYLIGNSIYNIRVYVPYYIQIYKYIYTHMYRWEKCDIIYRIR